MADWSSRFREHRLFLLLLVLRYLVPIVMFGGIHARAHDNLDSETVYSVVIGRFWSSGADPSVFEVFLGGVLDWAYFTRVLQPLSLSYAVFDPVYAYFATEVLLLILAYAGMRMLLTQLNVPQHDKGLLACLFAFGLSYSTYGTGLAGAPLLMALTLRSNARVSASEILVAFLLGANASLPLHGVFIPVVALALWVVTGLRPGAARIIWIQGAHLAGSVITSAGLFITIFGREASHRGEWQWTSPVSPFRHFIDKAVSEILTQGSAYHGTITPALYTAVVLIAAVFVGGHLRRAALLITGLIMLAVALLTFRGVISSALPGPLSSIQYQRIALFVCLLTITLAGLVLKEAPFRWEVIGVRWVLALSLVLFSLAGMGFRANISVAIPAKMKTGVVARSEISGEVRKFRVDLAGLGVRVITLAEVGGTFEAYFRTDEYTCLRKAVAAKRVISFGLDPMIAPFHGIAAVDGYHNLYPLSYKHAFRSVIEAKLAASPILAQYFDGWGGRVYTYATRVPEVLPDFTAARQLGAEFVISDRRIEVPNLERIPLDCAGELQLYRIGQL